MGHNKLYGVCENKCFVEVKSKAETESELETIDDELETINYKMPHRKEFTYVVNSNASLEYWLTNKASGTSSGGNDFTSVLIKKGTWTFTGNTVELDTIGTLYVEGEAGSKLSFTNTDTALQYSSLDKTLERSMYNVHVNVNHSTRPTHGFLFCSNLTNCSSVANSNTNQAVSFSNCFNLTNCCAQAKGSSGINTGFSSCTLVSKCRALGHCTNTVFTLSYASNSKGQSNACDDTAEGGFNDKTNPSE